MDAQEIDALEKATRNDSRTAARFIGEIVALADSPVKAVRWHVARLLPRLHLRGRDKHRRLDILRRWLEEDDSAIVRVNALQSFVELARGEPGLDKELFRRLDAALRDRSAAVRARARILIQGLQREGARHATTHPSRRGRTR